MIRSMTGFGKSSGEYEGKKISVEVKTLNSKMNDTKVRLPNSYRDKELVVRNMIGDKLGRGKIELYVSIAGAQGETSSTINQDLALDYFAQLKELGEKLEENNNLMGHVLRMPGVLETEAVEADESEWTFVKSLIEKALEDVNSFRLDEGKQLEADLLKRIDNIEAHLEEVIKLAPERAEMKQEKLTARFKEMLEEADTLDQNRFEQELIYYLEKLDITEEKVRLRSHLDYFRETVSKSDSQGKKLGFISQEMGREINTIGSKANHAEMQKHVVLMKDELEKIKEQVLNVL